jgi:hypothetical protein
MRSGMIEKSIGIGVITGILALNSNLNAFAGSEAIRLSGSSASTSSSVAIQKHNEANVAGEQQVTKRTATTHSGIRTVGNKRAVSHRRHSRNSSRSYMLNTIQQAARTK